MNDLEARPVNPPLHLKVGVITHLVEAVMFGYVTIRFENGRPTLIERHENVKLTGGSARQP